MAPKKRKTTVTKVKKKKWFPIHAPKSFSEALLGESYVAESSELEGKYITSNLSTITRSMRKQSINVQFKVESVVEGKGQTTLVGYSLINAAVKRLVRRGRDKVSDSFLAKSKDKKVLRIKPIIITQNHGTKSVQSAVRLEARRFIREYAFTKTAEEFLKELTDAAIQKKVKEACAKIFPLRSVDIKYAKILENTDVIVTDKDVVSEKVTIRVKDKGEEHISEEELKAREAAAEAERLANEDVAELTEANEEADVSESESEVEAEVEELPNATEEEDENSEEADEAAEEAVEESGVAEEDSEEPKKEE